MMDMFNLYPGPLFILLHSWDLNGLAYQMELPIEEVLKGRRGRRREAVPLSSQSPSGCQGQPSLHRSRPLSRSSLCTAFPVPSSPTQTPNPEAGNPRVPYYLLWFSSIPPTRFFKIFLLLHCHEFS